MDAFYNEGSRVLQDRFDARRIADRLEQVDLHQEFKEWEGEFIESAPMFFLATVDAEGCPDVSYKGGLPGFVRIVGPSALEFPNYDGNGMYKSTGNILVNPNVALLFIHWGERPKRLRVHGSASLIDHPADAAYPGAQFVVRVDVDRIFDNCPRYIHRMELMDYSRSVPQTDQEPPVPDWKLNPLYRDALPSRDLDPGELDDSEG